MSQKNVHLNDNVEKTIIQAKPSNLKLRSLNDHSEFPLGLGVMLVGREPECQIALNSGHISRYHAKLLLANDNIVIEDLNSTNGTFVNGRRISAPLNLSVGDEIKFHELQFRVVEGGDSYGGAEATLFQSKTIIEKPKIPPVSQKPKVEPKKRKPIARPSVDVSADVVSEDQAAEENTAPLVSTAQLLAQMQSNSAKGKPTSGRGGGGVNNNQPDLDISELKRWLGKGISIDDQAGSSKPKKRTSREAGPSSNANPKAKSNRAQARTQNKKSAVRDTGSRGNGKARPADTKPVRPSSSDPFSEAKTEFLHQDDISQYRKPNTKPSPSKSAPSAKPKQKVKKTAPPRRPPEPSVPDIPMSDVDPDAGMMDLNGFDDRLQPSSGRKRVGVDSGSGSRLVMLTASTRGNVFSLASAYNNVWLMGRAQNTDFYIPDKSISPEHARISKLDDEWLIEACDSNKAPLFINNRSVKGSVPLQPEDLIRIGCVELVFRMDEKPAGFDQTNADGSDAWVNWSLYGGLIAMVGVVLGLLLF